LLSVSVVIDSLDTYCSAILASKSTIEDSISDIFPSLLGSYSVPSVPNKNSKLLSVVDTLSAKLLREVSLSPPLKLLIYSYKPSILAFNMFTVV
jgi:hypothetical protein